MGKYIFDEDKKQLYCALIILDAIVDKGAIFSEHLSGDDIQLSFIFDRMVEKELLVIENHDYVVAQKGTELINNFYDRYQEFLRLYDIYCAVDLAAGEFAFDKILDMPEEEFQEYVKDKRWDDLRIAVCEFKKIDPMQMVFMSFLREGRVDIEAHGWQTLLLKGKIWADVVEICVKAVSLEDLAKTDKTPDDQIKNIVSMGTDLLKNLLQKEKEMKEAELKEETESETVTTITEEITVIDDDMNYYDPYWDDPYYASPCWGYYYYSPYWW